MSRPLASGRRAIVLSLVAALLATACSTDAPSSPDVQQVHQTLDSRGRSALADTIRMLARGRKIGPMATPRPVRYALVNLGQALAFDKELSGNRDIACMSCHLPAMGTGDGRALSIGTGATGLGLNRVHPTGLFIPRNAPPAFNLTALDNFFWDGRVTVDRRGRYHTPAGDKITPKMTRVFEFGALSALPLFPVMARDEMRGFGGNELAAIDDEQMHKIWNGLMVRLGRIPEYRRMFEAAYPGTHFRDMTFAHASNAIAGYLIDRLTMNNSAWDRFLAGNDHAMTPEQMTGAKTFMQLKCSICHNGANFTDNQFHNVAVAQFGPGKGNGAGGRDDFGRFNVDGNPAMKYAFRTPGLRNVVLTAPYGHDGAIHDLREFITHYSESDVKLRGFDPLTLEPLLQGTVLPNVDQILATRDTIIQGVVIPDVLVDQLTAFMTALTDDPMQYRGIIPRRVPSGLPIDNP